MLPGCLLNEMNEACEAKRLVLFDKIVGKYCIGAVKRKPAVSFNFRYSVPRVVKSRIVGHKCYYLVS